MRSMVPTRSSGRASNHEPSASRTRVAAGPSPARLAPATAKASGETSLAHTRVRVRSAAMDSPMAPDPVPRSTTTSGVPGRFGAQPVQLGQGEADHLLGLGPGDQDPPVDHEVEGAEGPPAEDVLQRLARPAPGHQPVQGGHPPDGGRPIQAPGVVRPLEPRGLLDDPAGLGVGPSHPRVGQQARRLGLQLAPGDRAVVVRRGRRHVGAGGCARRPPGRRRRRRARRPGPCRACTA